MSKASEPMESFRIMKVSPDLAGPPFIPDPKNNRNLPGFHGETTSPRQLRGKPPFGEATVNPR